MLITIDLPEGEHYDFDTAEVDIVEAEQIEKVCGCNYSEWWTQLEEGNATAHKALVWTLRKREDSALRFSDVRFPIGGLKVEIVEDPTPPPVGDTSD